MVLDFRQISMCEGFFPTTGVVWLMIDEMVRFICLISLTKCLMMARPIIKLPPSIISTHNAGLRD
jgi:hypothetical protein